MNILKNKIREDLKDSMKKGEATRTSTIKMVIAAIANKEIELGKKDEGLSDEETLNVIRSEAKKRKDSMEEFQKGGRPELVLQEKSELMILETYLPPEISDEEILAVVKKGIIDSQAGGPVDFGKAMKVIAPLLKGKASGNRIADILRKELGQ